VSRARRTFPVTYAFPRDGIALRVTIGNEDELRLVRTELELLRRVRRQVRQIQRRPGSKPSRRVTSEQRRELMRIIADAEDPAVDRALRRIDWDFPAVRHEIVMAAVDDEAARIVQDAVSMEPTDVTDHSQLSPGDESTLEFALADAEAQLDALNRLVTREEDLPDAGSADEVASGAGGTAGEPNSGAADVGASFNGLDDGGLEAALNESLGSLQDDAFETSEASDERLAARATRTDDECPRDPISCERVAAATAPSVAEVRQANRDAAGLGGFATSRADRCGDSCDDAAASAVAIIESGLRRLGDVLTGEVRAKRRAAQASLDEIGTLRLQVQQTLEASREIAAQLARIRDELEINRDQTDVYRREAALFRDDALKAKQLAERYVGAGTKGHATTVRDP